MRLIDADALLSHLNDYALTEAPIYGRDHKTAVYEAIQNCMKAVEEAKTWTPGGFSGAKKNGKESSEKEWHWNSDMTGKTKGYKGFLMISCKECGHVNTFCSKNKISQYKCPECGKRTTLKDLRLLWANCECGKISRYFTNIEDPVTEVNCVDCGMPVAVTWNAKKACYQTIREKW